MILVALSELSNANFDIEHTKMLKPIARQAWSTSIFFVVDFRQHSLVLTIISLTELVAANRAGQLPETLTI